jgi:hypothetical protein
MSENEAVTPNKLEITVSPDDRVRVLLDGADITHRLQELELALRPRTPIDLVIKLRVSSLIKGY